MKRRKALAREQDFYLLLLVVVIVDARPASTAAVVVESSSGERELMRRKGFLFSAFPNENILNKFFRISLIKISFFLLFAGLVTCFLIF